MLAHLICDIDALRQQAASDARDVCERWDVPRGPEVPADLKDQAPKWFKTRSGQRVVGKLSPDDLLFGSESTAREAMIAILPALTSILGLISLVSPQTAIALAALLALPYCLTFSTGGWRMLAVLLAVNVVSPAMVPVIFLVVSVLFVASPYLKIYKLTAEREINLMQRSMVMSGESNGEGRLLEAHVEARQLQVKNANADKTPLLTLGEAKGVFSAIGDGYAPDAGLPLAMSAADLSTHLFSFGFTGTGKTAGMLRPIARYWISNKCGGLLVLDGKGELPFEFSNLENFQVLHPGEAGDPQKGKPAIPPTPYGLVEGLVAEDIVDVIANTMSDGDGNDFWTRSGETMLRSACVLMEFGSKIESAPHPITGDAAANAYGWTLYNIRRVCVDKEYRDTLVQMIEGEQTTDAIIDAKKNDASALMGALRYFKNEFSTLAENTASSIVGTVDSWLSPIIGHRDLLTWATSTTGLDPTSVLRGARIGVATPAFKYGKPGLAIQSLVKARIYRAARQRGSNWKKIEGHTPAMILMDECQDLLSKADVDIFAVARSLGIVGVAATQTYDGLIARMNSVFNGGGEYAASALISNFRSLVSYNSSPRTLALVKDRLGYIQKRIPVSEANGLPFGELARNVIDSGVAQPQHELTSLVRFLKSPIRGAWTSFVPVVERDGQEMAVDEGAMNAGGVRAKHDYKLSVEPLLDEGEASAWLQAPFSAVAQVQRGNVIRRDIIRTTPIFN